MYESFYGLRERPFDLTPNPRFLVLTEQHSEVLSNLEYGIGSRKGITLLIGEAGSGKTTLIHAAIERLPTRVHCVHLHNPTLKRDEFVQMLAARFELSPEAGLSKATMLLELERLLRDRYERDETTVLIMDEAQSLPLDLLEEVRLLANIETNEVKLLSVIIAGQPELAARLNERALRQLKQRVALRCELRPLSETETIGYIAGRIAAAGGSAAQLFTREAVTMIHDRSKGIPRMVSVIADNCLLGGFAAGVKPVGSQIVREVCRDFDLGPSEDAARDAARELLGFDVNQPAAAATPQFGGPALKSPDEKEAANFTALQQKLLQVQPAPTTDVPQPPEPTESDGRPPRANGAAEPPKKKRFSFFS